MGPFGVDPLLVEQDELLGDLAHGRAHPALGLGEVGPAEAVEGRCLAADVLAQDVDLVRRYVEPIVALVGDEQVVALDATDAPLHHALIEADAVLDVDDVHAGLEVFERGDAGARRAGATVGPAAPGEIALGDDGQPGGRQRDAVVQRRGDDVASRPGEVTAAVGVDGEVEALVAEERRQPFGGSLAVRGHDDAVAVAEQLPKPGDEPGTVADHRAPPRRLHDRASPATPATSRSTTPRRCRPAVDPARRAGGGT